MPSAAIFRAPARRKLPTAAWARVGPAENCKPARGAGPVAGKSTQNIPTNTFRGPKFQNKYLPGAGPAGRRRTIADRLVGPIQTGGKLLVKGFCLGGGTILGACRGPATPNLLFVPCSPPLGACLGIFGPLKFPSIAARV